MKQFLRSTVFPLFLIVACPPVVLLVWHTNATMGGSLEVLWHFILRDGFFTTIMTVWRPVIFGTPIAWKIIFTFMLVQLILMRVVPGKEVTGPLTPQGNTPKNKHKFLGLVIRC